MPDVLIPALVRLGGASPVVASTLSFAATLNMAEEKVGEK
jgi:hypothetical protein